MTHYRGPVHHLTSIEARLTLPQPHEERTHAIVVHGRSATRRSNLWTYQEFFDPEVAHEKGYSVADALHHIALVCVQDAPNTLERLDFALSGGLAYVEPEMFPGWGAD